MGSLIEKGSQKFTKFVISLSLYCPMQSIFSGSVVPNLSTVAGKQ